MYVAAWLFFFLKHRVCEPPKEFPYNLKGSIVILDVTPSRHFSLLTRASWKVLCTKWCPCCLLLPFWQVPLRGSLDLDLEHSVASLLSCIFKSRLGTDLSRADTTVLCSETKYNCTCVCWLQNLTLFLQNKEHIVYVFRLPLSCAQFLALLPCPVSFPKIDILVLVYSGSGFLPLWPLLC